MLSEKDKDTLDDLCAMNGVDEVMYYFSMPRGTPVGGRPILNKFHRACAVAFRLMNEREGVKVQSVTDL